jgi:thiamine-phosphate pyrophosphorylase
VIPALGDGGARLYPIVDVDTLRVRGLPIVPFAERVLAVRPALLQLRAKSSGARETLQLLRALSPLCRAQGTLLFANDRPDLAVLGGADGVHVGQDDLPVGEVRRFAPELRVGVSTHNLEQLGEALRLTPDYVAFGPVFGTNSKARPDPTVGLDGLCAAAEHARAAGVPLVAIGGIDRERAPEVAKAGAIAAVIAALIPHDGSLDSVTDAARALEIRLG